MKTTLMRLVGLTLAVVVGSTSLVAQEHKAPPKTQTDNVTETIHGVEITDPYRWLEDQNSPQTRTWINSQKETQSLCSADSPAARRFTTTRAVDENRHATAPFERGGRIS